MTRIAWLTDLHLNFVDHTKLVALCDDVRSREVDAVLIGGDIAEARDVIWHLRELDEQLDLPIYFVLGNHDFYFGSIDGVRREMAAFAAAMHQLSYLSITEQPIELAPGVGLVGHDGWADGQLGDYERSMVMMNDYRLIDELSDLGKEERWAVLKQLGDDAAAHIRRVLPAALDAYSHVVLLTHVPPTRESCWYEGHTSDDEWAPHFTCKAVGDAILEIMPNYPDHRLTVLCGHTHSAGESHPLENVVIYTGKADYGQPAVQRVFEW
jgi:Icc protein